MGSSHIPRGSCVWDIGVGGINGANVFGVISHRENTAKGGLEVGQTAEPMFFLTVRL